MELHTIKYVKKQYRSGQMLVIFGYVPNAAGTDLEPCMALITSRKRALGNNAYLICLSSAQKYMDASGNPTRELITETLPHIMAVLDIHTQTEGMRLVDAIWNFLPDLIRMPPVSAHVLAEHNRASEGDPIGEASIIAGGKTVAERLITTDTVH